MRRFEARQARARSGEGPLRLTRGGDPADLPPLPHFYSRGEAGAKGVTTAKAQALVDAFAANVNPSLGLTYHVVSRPSAVWGDRVAPADDTAKGGTLPKSRVIFIFADNHTDAKDIARTIRHETFGHFGLNVLAPSDKRDLLDRIGQSESDGELGPVYQKVREAYPEYANEPLQVS